jgi:acetyl esterase/lipase
VSRKRFLVLLSVFVSFGVVLFLDGSLRKRPGIVVERDLTYGTAGGTELKLDLARPKEESGPYPAIVFLHGEGWRAGSRRQMSHFIEGVARMGYVGVTVEYRLVPAARFPAQVEDCKAALGWLRANAEKHRIDPGRIGVVGFSAGGHLAAMLGVAGEDLQAVVSFFGPTDFTTRDWPPVLEREVIVPFLGGTYSEIPAVYERASPVSHVTKVSAPFLLFHGSEDELVPVDQSKRLAERLRSFGVPVRLVVLEGEKHGFSDAHNQECMKQMMEFLGERLKKSKRRT